MRTIHLRTKFKKDYKLALKRGCDPTKLEAILELLVEDQPLPERNRNHQLTGDYIGKMECHISPDWLLIYELVDREGDEENQIILWRTGTHSDLFK